MIPPPDAKVKLPEQEGREVGFGGIARRIERYYRRYRQRGEANSRMEAWLDKVMVEHTCPDCKGAQSPSNEAAVHGGRPHHLRRRPAQFRRAADVSRRNKGGRAGRGCGWSGAVRDSRAAEGPARNRPRLSQFQPPIRDAVGRRIAAHPAVDADWLRPDGDALRPRRTEHRAPPEGQLEDDRDARAPARHRQHRHCRRARRGYDSRRRPRRRDGSGAWRARRPCRGPGIAERRPRVPGLAHGAVLLAETVDSRPDAAAQRERQVDRRARRRARTT